MKEVEAYHLRMSSKLFREIEKYIEVHEKKTGLSLSMADFFRIAASEKLLRK